MCHIIFEIDGVHRFLGTDCGNTAKHKNFKSKTVPTEFGKCLLVMQATEETSRLIIKARSKDGSLLSNEIEIIIK